MPESRSEQHTIFQPLMVNTEVYNGPLEVLLDLIRKKKTDIQSVPLAQICSPYLEYIRHEGIDDLETGGEFVALAALLLLIKSRTLLPVPETEHAEEEIDPEEELRQKLEEYLRFKEIAEIFEHHDQLRREVFPRPDLPSLPEKMFQPPIIFRDISIYRLLEAYKSVNRRKREPRDYHVVRNEEYPIEQRILELLEVLQNTDYIEFRDLIFSLPKTQEVIIITFIAVLELCKMKCVLLTQANEFESIYCRPAGKIYTQAEEFRSKLKNSRTKKIK